MTKNDVLGKIYSIFQEYEKENDDDKIDCLVEFVKEDGDRDCVYEYAENGFNILDDKEIEEELQVPTITTKSPASSFLPNKSKIFNVNSFITNFSKKGDPN